MSRQLTNAEYLSLLVYYTEELGFTLEEAIDLANNGI